MTPRNPLALSTKAARYGAVALLVGAAILVWPVWQGMEAARAGAPEPRAGTPWEELQVFGWQLVQEETR
ncbi:hypothetical protein [Jannaschia pohangensis]|uniref:Uncharacterized protein n=1 Tax=Jannaschia pohangensis TaxID=390807 RepID=A0A1I3IYH9_9RHOB|nr:hypothetical protein [Jannaschia pohangensis]SFI53032.1 hypothetical protein SAMN04488095_1146 [Jannaschia pohangensis]